MAEERGTPGWLPAAGGFLLGAVFLQSLDRLLPHLHPGSDQPEGLPARLRRTTMLVFAVPLHNLPEGMAVGLSFALAAQDGEASTLAGALALAIGIGLQNFPEGAAISLPLRQEGLTRTRSFVYGALSGVVAVSYTHLDVYKRQARAVCVVHACWRVSRRCQCRGLRIVRPFQPFFPLF